MPGLLNIFPPETLDQNHNKVHDENSVIPVLKGILSFPFFNFTVKC